MTKTLVSSIDLPEAPAAAPTGSPLVPKDMGLVGHVPVALTTALAVKVRPFLNWRQSRSGSRSTVST